MTQREEDVVSPPTRRNSWARPGAIAAVMLFVIARVVPFARARAGVDFDSFDYLDLARHRSVIAVLAAHRPPTYLLALKLVAENRQVITWLQLVVALGAWVLLAFATARTLRTQAGRAIGFTAILVLGSCLDVAQWDRVVGTESLSISLAVTIVASVLLWRDRLSRPRVAALAGLVTAWALLRDANALVAGVAGAVTFVVWLVRGRRASRAPLVLAALAVVLAIVAVVSGDIGNRWQQPMQNVITFRVLPSPERQAFFRQHGLPLTATEADALAGRCANRVGAFLCEKVTDPGFYDWIDGHARSVYVRSWFAFPATTVWEPLAHERTMIGARLPVAAITGTHLHAAYAAKVETVVYPRSPRVLLAWLVLLMLALAVAIRRRVRVPLADLAVALLALTYVHLWVVWSGDGVELARHGLVAALELELALLLLSIGLIDVLLLRLRRG